MAGVRLGLDMNGEGREFEDKGFVAFFGCDDEGNDVSAVDIAAIERLGVDFPEECASYLVAQSGDFCTVTPTDVATGNIYTLSHTEDEVRSNGDVFRDGQGMHLTDTL